MSLLVRLSSYWCAFQEYLSAIFGDQVVVAIGGGAGTCRLA